MKMLELQAVSKRWGGRVVLDNCTAAIEAGQVAVLRGANGAGKTTLLRIVAGIVEPSSGQVLLRGHCLAAQPLLARACLGYVPDGLDSLPDLLVSEFLALVQGLKGGLPGQRRAEVDAQLSLPERLGVKPLIGQRLQSLSFGQRKRVALLAALEGQPAVWVLDEPSNGLDPDGVKLVLQLVEVRRTAQLVTLVSTNDEGFATALNGARYELRDGRLNLAGH